MPEGHKEDDKPDPQWDQGKDDRTELRNIDTADIETKSNQPQHDECHADGEAHFVPTFQGVIRGGIILR